LIFTPQRFQLLVSRMNNTMMYPVFLDLIPNEKRQEYLNKGLLGAAGGYFGLIDKFLDEGAEIDYMDEDGLTAICYALSSFNDTNIRHLVEKGANCDLGMINGQTPKEFAASLTTLSKYSEILNN